MTEVFALMWLADVAGYVRPMFSVLGLLALLGTVVGVVLYLCCKSDGDEVGTKALYSMRALTIIGPALLVVSAAMPAKLTLQVLAAAKAGQVALSTPTGTKAMQAINAVLDSIIDSAKDKK